MDATGSHVADASSRSPEAHRAAPAPPARLSVSVAPTDWDYRQPRASTDDTETAPRAQQWSAPTDFTDMEFDTSSRAPKLDVPRFVAPLRPPPSPTPSLRPDAPSPPTSRARSADSHSSNANSDTNNDNKNDDNDDDDDDDDEKKKGRKKAPADEDDKALVRLSNRIARDMQLRSRQLQTLVYPMMRLQNSVATLLVAALPLLHLLATLRTLFLWQRPIVSLLTLLLLCYLWLTDGLIAGALLAVLFLLARSIFAIVVSTRPTALFADSDSTADQQHRHLDNNNDDDDDDDDDDDGDDDDEEDDVWSGRQRQSTKQLEQVLTVSNAILGAPMFDDVQSFHDGTVVRMLSEFIDSAARRIAAWLQLFAWSDVKSSVRFCLSVFALFLLSSLLSVWPLLAALLPNVLFLGVLYLFATPLLASAYYPAFLRRSTASTAALAAHTAQAAAAAAATGQSVAGGDSAARVSETSHGGSEQHTQAGSSSEQHGDGSDGVLKQGWAKQKMKKRARWRKVYMRLSQTLLGFYDNPLATLPLSEYHLTMLSLQMPKPSRRNRFRFEMLDKQKNKPFLVCFKTLAEKQDWLQAFSQSVVESDLLVFADRTGLSPDDTADLVVPPTHRIRLDAIQDFSAIDCSSPPPPPSSVDTTKPSAASLSVVTTDKPRPSPSLAVSDQPISLLVRNKPLPPVPSARKAGDERTTAVQSPEPVNELTLDTAILPPPSRPAPPAPPSQPAPVASPPPPFQSTPPSQPAPSLPASQSPSPSQSLPVAPSQPPLSSIPPPSQPAPVPVPLSQPAPVPVPLSQPAPVPVPLSQPAPVPAPAPPSAALTTNDVLPAVTHSESAEALDSRPTFLAASRPRSVHIPTASQAAKPAERDPHSQSPSASTWTRSSPSMSRNLDRSN